MNKLQTNYNGNMPIVLNDIRWVDASVREAFYAIASSFGITEDESFKLSGCDVTLTVYVNTIEYACSDGYIFFKGEVLKVNAHTVTISNNPLTKMVIFDLDVDYDQDGLKTFEDTTNHDTYEIRQGILKAIDIDYTTPHMYHDAFTIHEVIVAKIIALGDSWKNVGTVGNPAFETGWGNDPNYEDLSFRKDTFGTVYLKGVATSATPVGTIFTLPAGYCPAFTRYFPCYLGQTMVMIALYDTGEVAVLGANSEQLIDLSSITFNI